MGEASKKIEADTKKKEKEADEASSKIVAEHNENASKASPPSPTTEQIHESLFAGNEAGMKAAKEAVEQSTKAAAERMLEASKETSGVPTDEEVKAAAYPEGVPAFNPSLMSPEHKPPVSEHQQQQHKTVEASQPATYNTRATRPSRSSKSSEE